MQQRTAGRVWKLAPLGVAAALGCAAHRAESSSVPVSESRVNELATPADSDPLSRLGAAEAALLAEDGPRAVALFGRVLGDLPRDSELRSRALIGLGRAQEAIGDCRAALAAYQSFLERFAASEDAVFVRTHQGSCQAELGAWQDSATSFETVAEAIGQLPSSRVEALARQGYAMFNLDRLDEADEILRRADDVYEAAARDQTERFTNYYFVGMARFYRAAIVHRRFRDVAIELPEKVMEVAFERKLNLLLEAQAAYNRCIEAKHMFWVSAAGFQLGHLFGEFYDALMNAPVPEWLDERQLHVYEAELKKQLRPVLDKAMWVFEKNLETARKLGYESPFIEQTRAMLGHMQSVLVTHETGLGTSRPRLIQPLDDASEIGATDPDVADARHQVYLPPMTTL